MIGSFKRRYLLSGNPTPHRFSDIWAQIFLLDKGKALENSYYKFRNKYMYPTDYMRFNWDFKPGAYDTIVEKIAHMSIMLTMSDELDLPERVIVDKFIDLPSDIMKKYKIMEKKLFLALDDYDSETIEELENDEPDKILASSRAVALQKCWQIAQGFVYETIEPEDETEKPIRKTHYLHEENLKLLKDIIEEQSGSPTMIVYHFGEDRERLTKIFPNAPILGNPTKAQQTGQIVNEWNANQHEVVLAHPKRIAHGANMQYGSGHTIIFYSPIWNADDYDQVIKRLERQGSEHTNIIVIRIIVRNTIHEAMIQAVEDKTITSNSFLAAIREYRNRVENEI